MRALNYFVTPCMGFLLSIVECAPTPNDHNNKNSLRFLTIEEHYTPQSTNPFRNNAVNQLLNNPGSPIPTLIQNINGSRLSSMDDNGIRIQVCFPSLQFWSPNHLMRCFWYKGHLEQSQSRNPRKARRRTSRKQRACQSHCTISRPFPRFLFSPHGVPPARSYRA